MVIFYSESSFLSELTTRFRRLRCRPALSPGTSPAPPTRFCSPPAGKTPSGTAQLWPYCWGEDVDRIPESHERKYRFVCAEVQERSPKPKQRVSEIFLQMDQLTTGAHTPLPPERVDPNTATRSHCLPGSWSPWAVYGCVYTVGGNICPCEGKQNPRDHIASVNNNSLIWLKKI